MPSTLTLANMRAQGFAEGLRGAGANAAPGHGHWSQNPSQWVISV